MDDVYNTMDNYKQKILIVFDDMISDISSHNLSHSSHNQRTIH